MPETVTIKIVAEEFEDFLYQTLDDLVVQHGQQITEYLQSFLIGNAKVYITKTDGSKYYWNV